MNANDLKPYPTYKPSGVEWIGDVPAHWEVLPNRAIFVEVNERGYPQAEMLSVTIAEGVIRQRTLLEDRSRKDASRLDRSAYKLIQPGDIAYNKMRAWQGAIGMSEYLGIVSPAYIVQRPRDGANARYLHYLLRTPAFATEAERWSYGIASDMWSLRPEHFKMIYACVPPPEEQAAIVRYLDHTDGRIRRYLRSRERLIELLNEYRQATIHETVTRGLDPDVPLKPSGVEWLGDVPAHWEMRRLRHAVNMKVSNVDKHSKEGELPVRLCNYVDVYKNDRITENMPFMRATAKADEIDRFRLEIGDVLITKDSEVWNDIGVPAFVEYSARDLVCGYHLALLRPLKTVLNGAYLFYALQSSAIAYQFHIAANGVTRYGLSQRAIKSALLPIPPLAEQAAIAAYLDKQTAAVDTAMTHAQREIELLSEYRTRLIVDVVTGQVDVREAGT